MGALGESKNSGSLTKTNSYRIISGDPTGHGLSLVRGRLTMHSNDFNKKYKRMKNNASDVSIFSSSVFFLGNLDPSVGFPSPSSRDSTALCQHVASFLNQFGQHKGFGEALPLQWG